jgi:hypothetical protein
VAMCKHHWGLFAAISIGLSCRKDQSTPSWLNNKEYTTFTDGLLANPISSSLHALQVVLPSFFMTHNLSHTLAGSFVLWVPWLHAYYYKYDAELWQSCPHLCR